MQRLNFLRTQHTWLGGMCLPLKRSIDCFRTVLLEVLLTIINDNMILNNTCRQDNPRECDLQLWNCSSGSSKWQAYSSKPCMLRSNKIQSLHSYKNVLYALFCFIRHYKHSMLPYIFWISLVFDVNHMIQSNSCEYCLLMTFWLWEFALNICW